MVCEDVRAAFAVDKVCDKEGVREVGGNIQFAGAHHFHILLDDLTFRVHSALSSLCAKLAKAC